MVDQRTLMAVCGHMDQVAGVRHMEFQDGRAAGLRCAMIHNGPLELPLMLDKCLDPAWIRYKGINLSLLTKPGLQGRNPMILRETRRCAPLWAARCSPAALEMSTETGWWTVWNIRFTDG